MKTSTLPRPSVESTLYVGVRLEPDMVARLDAYAARLSATMEGVRVSRSDALRVLIRKGLDLMAATDAKTQEAA